MNFSENKRESIVLILLGVIGAVGLLYFLLPNKIRERGHKELFQVARTAATPAMNNPVQKITGQLVRVSEHPEAMRPFRFVLQQYSKGAVYEMDCGDGSGRKKFDNGNLKHTFTRPGAASVTLFALYEGQEIRLDTLHLIVANKKVDDVLMPALDF